MIIFYKHKFEIYKYKFICIWCFHTHPPNFCVGQQKINLSLDEIIKKEEALTSSKFFYFIFRVKMLKHFPAIDTIFVD